MIIGEVTLKWPEDDMSHSLYLFPRLSWARLNSVERSTQQNLVLVSSDRKRSLSPQPLSSKKSFRENHSKKSFKNNPKTPFLSFSNEIIKNPWFDPSGGFVAKFLCLGFFSKNHKYSQNDLVYYFTICLQYVS